MAKGASSGILFDEYMRRKDSTKDDDKEEKRKSGLGASSGISFEEYMADKYDSSYSIDSKGVDSWFKSASEFGSSFKQGDTSKYTTDYGAEYKDTIKSLMDQSTEVRRYLRDHRDEIKDYNSVYDSYSQFSQYLRSVDSHINDVNKYYSQFDSEGHYNAHKAYEGSIGELYLRAKLAGDSDEGSIAYTTKDGQNVTWQDLYELKKAEVEYDTLSSKPDWEEKSAELGVESLTFGDGSLSDEDIIFEISRTYMPHELKYAIEDGYTEEQFKDIQAKREYISKKYGMDVVNDIYGDTEKLGKTGNLFWYMDDMTDNEKAVFTYIYNTQGADAAHEWLDPKMSAIEQRKAHRIGSELQEDSPVLANALSVVASLASGIEYVTDAVDYSITGNEQTNALATASSTIRGATAQNIESDFWKFMYNTGMSGVDSLAASTLPGGTILLAGSAAAQGYNDAISRGMSTEDAYFTGFRNGVNEYIFERFSMGNFKGLKDSLASGGKAIAKNLAKTMFVNATEETATEIANIVSDRIFNADLSQVATAYRQYLANGVSPDEAKELVKGDINAQIFEAGLSGAVMGLGFGAIGNTAAYLNYNQATQQWGEDIINNDGVDHLKTLANDVAGVSKNNSISKLANKVSTESSRRNARNVGKLSYEVDTARMEQNRSDIVKALEQKGVSKLKAKSYADALVDMNEEFYRGEASTFSLGTDKQWKKITGDENAYSILREVVTNKDSSVNARNTQHNLARRGIKMDIAQEILKENYAEKSDAVKAKVSENGTAKVIKTDTEVTLKGIDHIETVEKDGKEVDVAYLKVADADGNESVVEWGDVEFSSRNEAVLYETFVGMDIDPVHFDAFVKNFNEADFDGSIGEAAVQYAIGFRNAYRYGWANMETELGGDVFASKLTESVRNTAYTLGKETVTKQTEAKQKSLDTAVAERKASGKGKAKTKGKLHMEGVKTTKRTAMQNAGVGLANRLTDLGIDVYVYESRKVNGQWVDENGNVAPNGYYRAKDGSIHIDLNAGEYGQGIMVYTLAHELTHFMRDKSPKQFKVFADLLVKWYGEKGETLNGIITKTMNDENLSWDDAYEEVIARSCESFLTDSNIADRILELQNTDKGLWETIRDKVLEFLKWMKSLFTNVNPESYEGDLLRQYKSEIDHLYDAFYNTLADAVETNQWAGSIAEAKTNAETLATAGITVDANTGSAVMNSVRYAPKTQAEIDKVAKALSESMGVSIEKAKAWVKSETSLASVILDPSNAMFLDYEADDRYEAIKKNAEYPQGTVDFSNLCKKRREFTALLDKLQKEHPNRIITAEEMEKIRQILIEENVEVACGLCYVEERRQLLGEIAQGFIDGYKNGTLKENIAKELDGNDSYVPTIYDLITYDGYRVLTTEHPSIAKAFQKFNNARGMQAGRLIEGIAEYKRDILNWSQKKVDFVNSVGGLRVFSFSDFEATHLIDLVQVVQDCAAKGVMIQAYTKVPAFANAVKDTNMKVNRSLIAKGTGIKYENGRMVLDLDPVEGIDINDKDFFDSTDSKNVGNVLVGMSNEQIRLAMKTPFVDYIIPFHTSLKGEILGAKKIDHWDNYKNFQTDKEFHPEKVTYKKDGSIKSDGWVVAENQINVYVDVIQAAEAEGKPIKNKVDFVNKFLAVAKEKGLKPRFWQFLDVDANGEYTYTEGYHKFLVDFKLFDQDGNILPQESVVPEFDDVLNARILNEYVEGKKMPAPRDAVYDRLVNEVIKHSSRKPLAKKGRTAYNEFASIAMQWARSNVTHSGDRKIIYDGRRGKYILIKATDAGYVEVFSGNYEKARSLYEQAHRETDSDIYADSHQARIERGRGVWDLQLSQDGGHDVRDVGSSGGKRLQTDTSRDDEHLRRGDREEHLKKSSRQKAPTFYSYMGVVVDGVKQDKLGAASVINLLKGKGVKDEEIKWSGIETWLEGKKSVTKAELQEFIAGSQLQIVEQISDPATDEDEGETKWSEYKLNGGTNYREIVFQMPNSSYSNQMMRVHWGEDAEGVLVHARIQDFDVNGQKMLFVEEIQSDWHNAGHKSGYVEKSKLVTIENTTVKHEGGAYRLYRGEQELFSHINDAALQRRFPNGITEEQIHEGLVDHHNSFLEGTVPDAPFRDTYHEFVLKRLIRMAAEEGYDSIGWTTADNQMDRWNPRRNTNRELEIKDAKNPDAIAFEEAYSIEYDQDIPKFLRKYGKKWGATVSYTQLNNESNRETYTDNEGKEYNSVRAWYDSVMDSYAEKDKSVWNEYIAGRTKVIQVDNTMNIQLKQTGEILDEALHIAAEPDTVWSMPITDSMKDSVLYEGQVMYQQRGTGMSNRSLLANALSDATQNDSEARRLAEYKAKIDLINSEDQKLRETRERIAELSFASGPKDTVAIKNLQDTATRIANRINTYDKQLLNLEATAPLKAVLEREKSMARKREKEKAADALAKYREKSAETLREVMNRNTESRKKSVESRKRTVVRNKIKRVVTDLNGLLNRGTKERNVKTDMQETVGSALKLANVLFNDEITNEDIVLMGSTMATEEEQKLLDQYVNLIKKRDSAPVDEAMRYINKMSDLNRKLADLFKRERARLNQAKVSEAVDELAKAYANLKVSDKDYVNAYYSEEAHKRLLNLSESLGGTVMKDMSLAQLEEVYDAYKMIRHIVRESNSLFRMGKTQDLAKTVTSVQEQILSLYQEREKDPRASAKKIGDFLKNFAWNEMKPLTAFETLGADAYTELFWDAIKAEGEWAKWMEEANAFLDEQRSKFNYKSWDMDTAHEFTLPDGKVFRLTLQEMLSIYAYSKREQAQEHMTVGGFQFDKHNVYKDNDKKKRVRLGDLYVTDWTTIGNIIGSLTDEQKHYADAVQKYLTDMGQRGNEVSEILYGIGIFNETAYFPLMSAKDYRSSVEEALNNTQTQVSLKNTGMTKQTVPHASNPIILQRFDDVAIGHIDKMAKYCTQVLAIENLRRVFDSVSADDNGGYASTKAVIEKVFGESAKKYFDQYITDLNGGTFTDGAENPWMTMFSKFKGTAVGASLSVVVQQPMAVIRAMDVINAKHFIGGVSKAETEKLYDEIKRYAPVAILKEMGGFDVGSSRTARDYLGVRTDKGFNRAVDEVNDLAMWGASKADELGWGIIWKAVKREVASNNEFKPGTAEFLEACGERFTEVIVRTQVYDSVNSRSGYMRSKRDSVKYATSFMGEPTTVINEAYLSMLKLSRANGKQAKKQAMGKLGRTMGVLVTSTLLTTIAKSLVYAMRDKEDDEAFLERWAKQVGDNLGLFGDLNPMTMLPFARDLVSIFEGFGVDRPDMTLIGNAVKSARKFLDRDNEEQFTNIDEVIAFIGDTANMFGLPVKNVIRDARGIVNAFGDIFDDVKPTDMGDAFIGGLTGEEKAKTDALYDAIVNGDTGKVNALKKGYKDDKAVESAIRKALRENDPRIKEAAKARYEGDVAEYMRIVREIKAEGHFSQDTIVSAINTEISELKPKEESKPSSPAFVTSTDYYNAIVSGQGSTAESIKNDLIAEKVADGDTQDDAEDSVVSGLVSQVSNAYKDGELTRSSAESILSKHCDKDADEIYWTLDKWDYAKQNGSTDGYSKYGEFHTAVETGKNLKATIKRYTDHGVEAKTLASQITSYFKPLYKEMSNAERANIKGYLLNAYALLGYNRFDKSKDIDAWLKY